MRSVILVLCIRGLAVATVAITLKVLNCTKMRPVMCIRIPLLVGQRFVFNTERESFCERHLQCGVVNGKVEQHVKPVPNSVRISLYHSIVYLQNEFLLSFVEQKEHINKYFFQYWRC